MKQYKLEDGSEVFEEHGDFAYTYPALKKECFELPSTQQLARARIIQGTEGSLSGHERWVSEAHIYQPNDLNTVLIVSAKHNPILTHPEQAVAAHEHLKEFHVDVENLVSLARRDVNLAKNSGVLALSRSIFAKPTPVDFLAQNPYFSFLLGEQLKPYTNFLKSAGIREVSVALAHEDEKSELPFARLLNISHMNYDSFFNGGYWLGGPDVNNFPICGIKEPSNNEASLEKKLR